MSENDLPEVVEPEEPIEPVEPEKPEVIGYVTLDEANTYVEEHYLSTETQRQNWEVLEDPDKAILLRRSFQVIELLPFTGHKSSPSQPTAFPRCPCTKVPEAIKYAQIEQALVATDDEASEEAAHYAKLWQWGVSSYTIGNLHESLGNGSYGAGALRTAGVTSAAASKFLTPFIQGGFNIR